MTILEYRLAQIIATSARRRGVRLVRPAGAGQPKRTASIPKVRRVARGG